MQLVWVLLRIHMYTKDPPRTRRPGKFLNPRPGPESGPVPGPGKPLLLDSLLKPQGRAQYFHLLQFNPHILRHIEFSHSPGRSFQCFGQVEVCPPTHSPVRSNKRPVLFFMHNGQQIVGLGQPGRSAREGGASSYIISQVGE